MVVQHGRPVLLEDLSREDLGEQVRRVLVRRYVAHLDRARTAHLPHLELLAVNVAAVVV